MDQVIVQGGRKIQMGRYKHNKYRRHPQREPQERRHRHLRHRHQVNVEHSSIANGKSANVGKENKLNYRGQHRGKRSISSPRHVEALIVADPSMVAFHHDGDVETYILTIMNMVSSLYKDPAIGNLIKIVVVRIVLLEENETQPDFNVTHLAENNLHNFCRYSRLTEERRFICIYGTYVEQG